MSLDLLIAGHIVKDITGDGWRAGGGALYAAAQAARLGCRVGVLTACADDLQPASNLGDVEWHVLSSPETTTFENHYEEGRRRQRLPAAGRQLLYEDIPTAWLRAPVALLSPVFHDLEPSCTGLLASPDRLLGLAAQGWLRRLDGDRVLPGRVEEQAEWLHGDFVFVSDEDVEDAEAVAVWQSEVRNVVLTRGRGGSTLWSDGKRYEIAPIPVEEVDPTGAGDVFSAACLVRYRDRRNVLEAVRFATAAAALSVQGVGLERIGTRAEIEALIRATVAA